MRLPIRRAASGLALLVAATFASSIATAAPALTVLGQDFTFPNKIDGMPAKLSEFKDLQINHFTTNDGVKLAYWEAGSGKPLIFIPGFTANGAEYLNVMYLLSKRYHVYVLDPRNQGLSEHTTKGMHIARFAADLKDFNEHLGLKKADYCGWSMGAAVLWSYIDLFGTKGINKVAFVDEPPSIYAHADWTEQERLDAGAITTSPERMADAFILGKPVNELVAHVAPFARFMLRDSPYFANSEAFAGAVVKNDPAYLKLAFFDHVTNDWRDVIKNKIDVPTAIFYGAYSVAPQGQQWIHSVVPNSAVYYYKGDEQGDHFLAFKNPLKFTADLESFLAKQ